MRRCKNSESIDRLSISCWLGWGWPICSESFLFIHSFNRLYSPFIAELGPVDWKWHKRRSVQTSGAWPSYCGVHSRASCRSRCRTDRRWFSRPVYVVAMVLLRRLNSRRRSPNLWLAVFPRDLCTSSSPKTMQAIEKEHPKS